MTRNFKKAALNSLDGKWGVGIGVSALFYFVPTLSASAIATFMYLIFALFIGIIGPDALFIYLFNWWRTTSRSNSTCCTYFKLYWFRWGLFSNL